MKTLHGVFIALTLFLIGFPASSGAFDSYFDFFPFPDGDLAVYDDFSGEGIDPKKWRGGSTINSPSPSPTADRRELVATDSMAERGREAKWGRLLMHGRSFGNTYDDPSRITFFRERLLIPNPTASNVTEMKVSLRVLEAGATACPENVFPTRIFFRAIGFFFNTGLHADGDVFARFDVTRESDSPDAADILRVWGRVNLREQSSPEIKQISLGSAPLGTVGLGERIKIRMRWEPDGDRFVFQRDLEPEVEVPYSVPDEEPAHRAGNKRLEILLDTPNCEGEPVSEASMKVVVDKVWVNRSALEPE